jgi:hypothetical protein
VVSAGSLVTVQEVSGGAGRGSQNSLPLEFGLGAEVGPVEVWVRWPNGLEEIYPGVAVDRYVTLVEGSRKVPGLSQPGLGLLALVLLATGVFCFHGWSGGRPPRWPRLPAF